MSPLEDPAAGGSFLEDPAAAIREALMAEHDRWAGTPYRFGGTGMSGIDCSALVQNIFSDAFQVQLPRTTG
ncbi:MAG TPA: glycoside hydrolase, partial [Cobetia sp.]|nr:glycoside hydrolase [Cobetia sp.]